MFNYERVLKNTVSENIIFEIIYVSKVTFHDYFIFVK